jgi:hypothetical protein
MDSCTTANQHCTNADTTRGVCYACGQAVCPSKGCSLTTTTWPGTQGKRVRICASCATEHTPAFERRIDADIYLAAGYPESAARIRRGDELPHWRVG